MAETRMSCDASYRAEDPECRHHVVKLPKYGATSSAQTAPAMPHSATRAGASTSSVAKSSSTTSSPATATTACSWAACPTSFRATGGAGINVATFFDVGFTNNPLLSNAIFSNGGLGIDLGNDGVTPNDACDADTGGNGLLNFPILTAVASSSSGTTVQGQLNSTPGTLFLLQFFSSAVPDPSGFGEGARFIGSTTVTTDAACNATFKATLSAAVTPGHVVTATATDPTMSTSEFSNALPFVPQTSEQQLKGFIRRVELLVKRGEGPVARTAARGGGAGILDGLGTS
jgi:hypothetical protein